VADLGTPAVSPNRLLWEKGDFTRIAQTMRASGEQLVDTLGITPVMKVLDLGSGDGTTALPAAQRGAEVLGVDIAANLVAAGNDRAADAGLDNVRFRRGDACDLSELSDSSFDLVISVFGAMFAPRPFDVAREMVRVTKPDGRIVMGNWIPGDPTLVAQILRISSAYTPAPPPGFVSPMTWGDEAQVRERFEAAGVVAADISFERATWTFALDGPPSELLAIFRDYYGPTMNAFEAAGRAGQEEQLASELAQLFAEQNRGGNGLTEIAATFLKVTATKR
jgi:SAM-dependent methyltransferase